ncbi:MAG: molybdenum cofactor guanylyltransferase [Desulfatibacillum sp.]|nr:molybdenum cofactor guanylyltransferase [Desulfatibacillum sp.]
MNRMETHGQGSSLQNSCAAAILAGGVNSRMKGRNKAFLNIQGRPIIDHLTERLAGFFREIIIISNDPLQYLDYDYPVYSDLSTRRCSLNGVHTALNCAVLPNVFMVPCDLPFLQAGMVKLLLTEQDPKFDIIIPQTPAGFEPLCAIYSRKCLKPAARMLETRNLSIRSFFSQVRVKAIPEGKLRAADPELLSFMNVNTPQDLENARTKEA